MSDSYPPYDHSEGHSNHSSRRKGKSTDHVGRPKDVNYDYVQGNRIPDDPPTYNPSKGGYPLATSRTQTVPNVRNFNDVGQYPSEQQQQLNAYSVAPLAPYPQGGQYAINSDTGNTTTAASTNSFNRQRTVVSQGTLFNVSPPSLNHPPNLMPLQPPVHPSQSYHKHSDHSAPTMRPSISDPSYDQRGDARHRPHPSKDGESRAINRSKPPYPYGQEQVAETAFAHDNKERFQPPKRDRDVRYDSSGGYKDRSSFPSSQYLPNPDEINPQGFMPERQPGKEEWANSNQDMVDQPQPRRPRENRRQPETATRDWSDEDEETSRERTPKVYFNKPQRPGMGTLQPQISTSWTGRDDQPLYGSPPNVSALQTKTSSSESVLTVRQGNLGSQWPKTQDNDLNLFTSPEHGADSKGSSKSTSLPTNSSLSSQRRQNSQSGRPTNQEVQDTSPYGAPYGSPRDPRNQGATTDMQNDDKYKSLERAPPLARGVSHPAQSSEGRSWHNLTSDSIQPHTTSRGQSRQEDTTNQAQDWTGPSNHISSGRSFSEGRPNLDQFSANVAPYPSTFQYPPNQMPPSGQWPGPYGIVSSYLTQATKIHKIFIYLRTSIKFGLRLCVSKRGGLLSASCWAPFKVSERTLATNGSGFFKQCLTGPATGSCSLYFLMCFF
ncbi:hypothetical protein BJ912DRAFT_117759 [Pholiota molesta]|nr:hypothetical protein BJ912DRAFT_117759 [Pholiota molesta]